MVSVPAAPSRADLPDQTQDAVGERGRVGPAPGETPRTEPRRPLRALGRVAPPPVAEKAMVRVTAPSPAPEQAMVQARAAVVSDTAVPTTTMATAA